MRQRYILSIFGLDYHYHYLDTEGEKRVTCPGTCLMSEYPSRERETEERDRERTMKGVEASLCPSDASTASGDLGPVRLLYKKKITDRLIIDYRVNYAQFNLHKLC